MASPSLIFANVIVSVGAFHLKDFFMNVLLSFKFKDIQILIKFLWMEN